MGKIKDYHKQVLGQWQASNNNNQYKHGSIILLFSALYFQGISFIFNTDIIVLNIINENFFNYIALLCCSLAISLGYYYCYTKPIKFKFLEKEYVNNLCKHILAWIFYIICFKTILILIPFVIMSSVMGYFLNRRAKKLDNWINMLIFIYFQLSLPLMLMNFFADISYILTDYIEKFLINFNFSSDSTAIFLFILLTLHIIISNIASLVSLRIYEFLYKRKRNMQDEKFFNDLKLNLRYYEKTHKRLQILLLSFLLICVLLGIIPNEFVNMQGQFLNVLTVYTIVMMYLDKLKEIK